MCIIISVVIQEVAMIYLDITLKILAISALVVFMTIAIWGFVVFNYLYSQIRYTNYLLEKISHILNISYLNVREKKKEEKISKKDTDQN